MLKDFFDPVNPKSLAETSKENLGGNIKIYSKTFPDLKNTSVVIFGIDNQADEIRKQLYKLSWRFNSLSIADLGNIKWPAKENDRSFALAEAMAEIMENNCFALIIGNSKDYSFGQYQAYRHLTPDVEYARIGPDIPIKNGSDLDKMITEKPNHLFNMHFMGTQAYFVSSVQAKLVDEMYFENHRLGHLRQFPEDAEPVLRTSHMAGFDVSAIRMSDAPDTCAPGPNGLYAEEAVLLCRYAGLSTRLKSLYFFGMDFQENKTQTPALVAQMIWYTLEGLAHRQIEEPESEHPDYLVYRNQLPGAQHEIVFYKSKRSNRWWLELPNHKNGQGYFIGCTYGDYQKVCNDEIPERWLKALQRVM